MIPPTSIDGTDITGATIDGTEVQEITVDGQTVFSGKQIYEDFESGNLNAYSGDLANFNVQSSTVFEGSFALQFADSKSIIHTNSPDSGNVPSFGTDFEFYVNIGTQGGQANFGYESTGAELLGGIPDGYIIRTRTDQVGVAGSTTSLGDAFRQDVNVSLSSNRWYRIKVTFSGGTATVEWIDTTSNSSVITITHGSFSSPGTGISFATRSVSGFYDGLAEI